MVLGKETNTDIIPRHPLPALVLVSWLSSFLQSLIRVDRGVLMKPAWSPTLSGPYRGLLYINYSGLTRLEAEREAVLTLWVYDSLEPNHRPSLHLLRQREARLVHMGFSPRSFDSGTWNPGACILYKNLSSSFLPPCLLSSLILSVALKTTQHHKSPHNNKKMERVLRGHWSRKAPASVGEAEIPRHEAANQAAWILALNSPGELRS